MTNDSSNFKAFVKMRIENWDEILRKRAQEWRLTCRKQSRKNYFLPSNSIYKSCMVIELNNQSPGPLY